MEKPRNPPVLEDGRAKGGEGPQGSVVWNVGRDESKTFPGELAAAPGSVVQKEETVFWEDPWLTQTPAASFGQVHQDERASSQPAVLEMPCWPRSPSARSGLLAWRVATSSVVSFSPTGA